MHMREPYCSGSHGAIWELLRLIPMCPWHHGAGQGGLVAKWVCVHVSPRLHLPSRQPATCLRSRRITPPIVAYPRDGWAVISFMVHNRNQCAESATATRAYLASALCNDQGISRALIREMACRLAKVWSTSCHTGCAAYGYWTHILLVVAASMKAGLGDTSSEQLA